MNLGKSNRRLFLQIQVHQSNGRLGGRGASSRGANNNSRWRENVGSSRPHKIYTYLKQQHSAACARGTVLGGKLSPLHCFCTLHMFAFAPSFKTCLRKRATVHAQRLNSQTPTENLPSKLRHMDYSHTCLCGGVSAPGCVWGVFQRL